MRTLETVVGGSRAAVLRSLQAGMRSVGEIVMETGLSQPNVSNHLARLREQGVVTPHREGKRIYYTVQNPELVRAILASSNTKPVEAGEINKAVRALQRDFARAVISLQQETARSLVDQALAQGIPWQLLYRRVFEPLLVRIGDLWARGEITVSEEHAASQLVERMMSHVASLRIPTAHGGACEVVVACAEGELHEIGPRMLADFLTASGCNVVFLGADVPNESLLAYVQRYHPSALAISASMEERLPRVRELAACLPETANGTRPPRLLLGGQLFQQHPELVAELCPQPVKPTLEAALDLLGKPSAA